MMSGKLCWSYDDIEQLCDSHVVIDVNYSSTSIVHQHFPFSFGGWAGAVGEFAPWNNPADQIGAMPWKEGRRPLSKLLSGGNTSTNSISHHIPSQYPPIIRYDTREMFIWRMSRSCLVDPPSSYSALFTFWQVVQIPNFEIQGLQVLRITFNLFKCICFICLWYMWVLVNGVAF